MMRRERGRVIGRRRTEVGPEAEDARPHRNNEDRHRRQVSLQAAGGIVARIVTGPHDAHRQDPHCPMRDDTGRPRAVIRVRISQPRTASPAQGGHRPSVRRGSDPGHRYELAHERGTRGDVAADAAEYGHAPGGSASATRSGAK